MSRKVSLLSSAATRPMIMIAVAVGMAACATVRTPVAVSGSAQDMSAFVGKWTGSYESPVTGRSGGIVFDLKAVGDSAIGNVDMLVRDTTVVANPKDPQGAGRNQRMGVTGSLLTIRFVRVDSSQVSGRLDPYTDPSCGCTVSTVFTGALSGDVIRGTFTTTGRTDARTLVTGTWKVTRER